MRIQPSMAGCWARGSERLLSYGQTLDGIDGVHDNCCVLIILCGREHVEFAPCIEALVLL